MIGHQSIDNLRPNDVVRPSLLAQYTEKMGIFSDDLTIAHTNLGILRQMREFDAELGGSGDTYHNSKSRLYRLRSCSPTPGRSQMIQSRKEVLAW